jgi:hypothetical protein
MCLQVQGKLLHLLELSDNWLWDHELLSLAKIK